MQTMYMHFNAESNKNTASKVVLKTEDDELLHIEIESEGMPFKEQCLELGSRLKEIVDTEDTLFIIWGDTCATFASINKLNSVKVKDIYTATSLYARHIKVWKILGIDEMSKMPKEEAYILKTEAMLQSAVHLDPEFLYALDPTKLVTSSYRNKFVETFDKLIRYGIMDNSFQRLLECVPREYAAPRKTLEFDKWNKKRLLKLLMETDTSLISSESSLSKAIEKQKETGELYTLQLTECSEHHKQDVLINLMRLRSEEHFLILKIEHLRQRRARLAEKGKFSEPGKAVVPLVLA